MTASLRSIAARGAHAPRRLLSHVLLMLCLVCAGGLWPRPAQAAMDLADAPLFSTVSVPGNLALALSVEWPTATTPAYPSTVAYDPTSTYLGYFDPAKCYTYTAVNSGTVTAPDYSTSYFAPNSAATSHACTSTTTLALWSGNYLNWSSMQTLDAFRWMLTGGYRSVDTTATTILTKTYAAQDSTVMPHKNVTSGVSGATPFTWASVATRLRTLGVQMYITGGGPIECSFSTSTADATTFTCYTSQDNKTCTANGTATCTMSVFTGASVSCARSGATAGPFTYLCSGVDALSAAGSQCTAANVAKVAGAATTASCKATNSGTNPVVDYTGQSSAAATAAANKVYRLYINVKVCDTSVANLAVETNCKAYATGSKPEGLMQQYASKLRYSAFGYYNHNGDTNQQRDGGVMRARMKYIGPTKPVPGSAAITNGVAEWDASTGVMSTNPDTADATATVNMATAAGWNVSITNSGVMNYLNKFGYSARSYKGKDPVSELYYATLRYFKNLGNVPEYTTLAGAGNSATAATWLDGFPSITTWDDPIVYSCQKNFVLGIGDVNTHRDTNLYGSLLRAGSSLEPPLPATVLADTSVNTATATNMVGTLEGKANLATIYADQNGTSCPNTGSQCSGYYIAGLAYDAHTKDIRADLTGTQTVNTYWMDVLENQVYKHKNQYWLATKYGGFDVPAGFDPYASGNGTTTIPQSAWYTNTDTLAIGTNSLTYTTDAGTTDKRPDNYFPGNSPATMLTGLTRAFSKISSEADAATSTAFGTVSPKITNNGTTSYSTLYDPKTWTGRVVASTITYADDGTPSVLNKWDARALLDSANVTATTRKIVTCCTSTGAALPFTATSLSAATLLGRTYYTSFGAVPGVSANAQSAANFVSYLRGDRAQEVANGGAFRTRTYRLGDIVNSKLAAVSTPDFPYYDVYNPGYSAYKKTRANRNTVVYVGANDGMLHAFDGSVGTTTSGKELFAYVPSFVYGTSTTAATSGLASLGNPSFTHHYLVDGSPDYFDIDFNNTSGVNRTTTDWRTVLIGGLGKGGKGYYAIDVSDANAFATATEAQIAGKVLWEFTDSRMGYTYGKPSMVKTAKYGWVLIFVSGYDNSDGKGYFFIVNPRTGALLEALATPLGSLQAPLNMGQVSAFVPVYQDFTADAAYATDMLGHVWRLDLTGIVGNYPEPKLIAQATAPDGTVQPISTWPLIEIEPTTKKRYLLFGTGRLLGDSDIAASQVQSFYAIVDGLATAGGFYTDTSLPTGTSFPIGRGSLSANTDLMTGTSSVSTSGMGWYYDLPVSNGIAQRVDLNPTANGGVVIFAGNLPNGQACSPAGTGTVYGLNISTGQSVLANAAGDLIASAGQSSIVTDVAIQRVGGKLRLYTGGSDGAVVNVRARLTATGRLTWKNWRELPTAD